MVSSLLAWYSEILWRTARYLPVLREGPCRGADWCNSGREGGCEAPRRRALLSRGDQRARGTAHVQALHSTQLIAAQLERPKIEFLPVQNSKSARDRGLVRLRRWSRLGRLTPQEIPGGAVGGPGVQGAARGGHRGSAEGLLHEGDGGAPGRGCGWHERWAATLWSRAFHQVTIPLKLSC